MLKNSVVVITGGRDDFADSKLVKRAIDALEPTVVVHGVASGADTLAGNYARSQGIPVVEVPALWDTYGKAAGPLRNGWMVEIGEGLSYPYSPTLLHFPGGRGTGNMIQQVNAARAAWKTVDAQLQFGV